MFINDLVFFFTLDLIALSVLLHDVNGTTFEKIISQNNSLSSDKSCKRPWCDYEGRHGKMKSSELYRENNCIPKLELQKCNTKFSNDPQWIWKRYRIYPINGIAEKGCKSSELKYIWTLYDYETGNFFKRLSKFENRPLFLLRRFALPVGSYILKLTVSEVFNGQRTGSTSTKCLLRLPGQTPIPIILGGTSRTVPSDVSFRVEGSHSLNMDGITYLMYRWSCKAEPVNSFCNDGFISTANYLMVPASSAKENTKFLFHLEVQTDYIPWVTTEQTVTVKKGTREIYIRCVKNCNAKINYRSVMFLQAECDDCPKDNYEWSMTPGPNNQKTTINFETETAYGKNNAKLVVKEGVLVPGDVYTFKIVYDGGNSESAELIKVTPIPKKGNCSIDPAEGKSLTTLFNINCQGFSHTDALTYRLFQRNSDVGGQGILLAANQEGQFKFYLSAEKSAAVELIIRISDTEGLYVEQQLTVSVTLVIPNIPADKQIQKMLDEYEGKDTPHESIESLISKGDTEGAIQMINALTTEARYISKDVKGFAEFRKKWKSFITNDLQKFTWEYGDALRQVATTIKNLNWADKNELDREFAKVATKLCKKIAEQQINNIKEPFSDTLSQDAVELSQDLLWCADTNMKANLTDIKPDEVHFNITTAFPLLPFPVIPENYPNYDDADLELALKVKDYQEITTSAMDIFNLVGLGIANTLAPGEPLQQIDNDNNILQIITEQAESLSEKILGGYGSFVKGSKSLAYFKSTPAHAVVTAFDKNPFWWNKESQNFPAHILNINYYIGDEKFENIGKPMKLFLDVDKTNVEFIEGSVSVPKNLHDWTPENLDYYMTVHRVDIRNGAALTVEFGTLPGNDKIHVVLKHNRRPYSKDFKKAHILHGSATALQSTFPLNMLKFGDAWFYVAVLPAKEMVKDSTSDIFTYNYTVSFVSSLCVYWEQSRKRWISTGCRTGRKTTATKLHCFCRHRSAFSGVYLNAPNKVDPIKRVPYVLAMEACYVIFICVCVVFGIYCIALIFAIGNKFSPAAKRVFFLGDNGQFENYAYLVAVKTGNVHSAGTTSNVGIKVFGQKCNSKAHVINYPDPDKKLLQKDKLDWFILTTEKHLGNMKYIYLWHDSVGLRPSWYCEWISISDLQTNEDWYFEIQKWFSVLKDETYYVAVKPSTVKPIRSWKYKWYRKMFTSIKQEHICNICKSEQENDLSYTKRITIVLSIILTTYSFSLVLYGTPALRLYDGFGYGNQKVYPLTILVAFLSSVLSYFWNFIIIMLFRKSLFKNKQEQRTKNNYLSLHKIAWIALISTIVTSLTFLVTFGFWVAYVTSLLWLSSTIGSLIQSALLIENMYIFLKLIIQNRFSKTVESTPNSAHIIEEIEKQRFTFFAKFGNTLLRPYFTLKYRPLTREEWKIKKEQELTRLQIVELIQDLIMFSIYIVVLYVVVLANKDCLNIYSHQEIKSLIYGDHSRTMNFEEIKTLEGFYEYINETLIPNIHSSNWYGTWEMAEPGLMSDFNIKILGVVRFRQLRVCRDCCEVARPARALNLTCFPEFSYWYNDVGEYMEYWKTKIFTVVPRLIKAWQYEYDAMPCIGEFRIYPGAGYSAPLGRTVYNSYYNLKYYKDTQWIDERTRVLFVEFLTYNVNYNIFHAVTLIIEHSSSGLFIKTHSISTTRLLFVKLELEIMLVISFAVFIAVLLIMFLKNIYFAIKSWKSFSKEPWNIIDIMIILMSFACIGIYVHRIYLVGEFLHQLEVNKHNKFVSYFNLIYADEVLTILASLLICVATIRLWKLLRFGIIFKIMERTLALSAHSLIAVAICHLIILLMFSFSGYMLFGAYSRDFRDLFKTVTTLILLSLNLHPRFNYKFLQEFSGGLGYIFYNSYMLITLTIFTLFIAVIILSYRESCNYYSNRKAYYTVQRHIHDESRYFRELVNRKVKNPRLSAGADDDVFEKKATPKSDEHRYADSVVMPTYQIFVMSLVARCVIFNTLKDKTRKPKLARNEEILMRKTVFHLLSEQNIPEPKSIVFTSSGKNNKINLVSNNRILKMEYIVNRILDEGRARNSKFEPFEERNETVLIGKESSEQLQYFDAILKSILSLFNNIRVIVPENMLVEEE